MKKESRKKVRISELNFENIGDRITFIRMMHGKTLEEFSSMLGISKGNLSDLENNKNKPSYDVITCIVENSNVNSEWVLSGTGKLFKRLDAHETDRTGSMEPALSAGDFFEQRELALKIVSSLSELEKLSRNAMLEVADYISIKMKNIISFGERRILQRRKESRPERAPGGEDRRSGKERRAHESYRE